MRTRAFWVATLLVGLVGVGLEVGTLKGQGIDTRPVVVCAPCSGAMFGIPAGNGMVLMQNIGGSNLLYFYPLDRRMPGPIAPTPQAPASSIYNAAPSPSAAANQVASAGGGVESAPILIGRISAPGQPIVWSR